MKIEYGLGFWDRYTDDTYEDDRLPLIGVEGESLPAFLKSAGEQGWNLCATMPFASTVGSRTVNGGRDLRKAEDPSEVMLLVFKRPSSGKSEGTPAFLTYMEEEVKKLEK